MVSDDRFLRQMRKNVARSWQHIARQNEIIARLARQGHHEAASRGEKLLVTMHGHLDMELEILDWLEDADRRRTLRIMPAVRPHPVRMPASSRPDRDGASHRLTSAMHAPGRRTLSELSHASMRL